MGWLIELLFGALRELCSQFIIDMMNIASGMFTEVLSCDLNLFEGLFGVAEVLYEDAVVPMAIALLLMILVWQLFKSMFGRMGTASEDPVELVFRSCFCLFMILFAKDIVNYILDIAGTPYQWITGAEISVDSFSGYVSALEAATSALAGDAISIQLLMLIMHFVVAWNYFKMLFILAERYVLLGVFSYTSPLAFATGGAKATNNILASWVKMFGGQVLVVLLDAWCVKMFLSAYGNLMASGYGFTRFFAATMCLIGFCKITAKLDSYMGSLGVNLGRIAGGMSGLGALLMAGRLLSGGGRMAGGKADGSGGQGGGNMKFGNGRGIPLGKGMPDFAASGNGGAVPPAGQGIGGMDLGGAKKAGAGVGEANPMPGSDKENGVGVFGAQEALEEPILPFGDPDAAENGTGMGGLGEEDVLQAGIGGAENGNSLNTMDVGSGLVDMSENGILESGMQESSMQSGMPGDMDMQGFDAQDMDAQDMDIQGAPVPDLGMEETGTVGMEDSSGTFFSGSEDGLEPYPADYSMAGDYQAAAEDYEPADSFAAGGAFSAGGGLAETQGLSDMDSGIGGFGASDLGAAGGMEGMEASGGSMAGGALAGLETIHGEAGGHRNGITGTPEAMDGGLSGYGTGERRNGGKGAGASVETGYAGGNHGAGHGALGSMTGMAGSQASEAATTSGGVNGSASENASASGFAFRPTESGIYGFEREGERFLRYDSSMYEKPEKPYQTIHEKGKIFYELPEREKAPERLPEAKAVLEKNGTVRLEQEKKTVVERNGIPGRKDGTESMGRQPQKGRRKAGSPESRKKPERRSNRTPAGNDRKKD